MSLRSGLVAALLVAGAAILLQACDRAQPEAARLEPPDEQPALLVALRRDTPGVRPGEPSDSRYRTLWILGAKGSAYVAGEWDGIVWPPANPLERPSRLEVRRVAAPWYFVDELWTVAGRRRGEPPQRLPVQLGESDVPITRTGSCTIIRRVTVLAVSPPHLSAEWDTHECYPPSATPRLVLYPQLRTARLSGEGVVTLSALLGPDARGAFEAAAAAAVGDAEREQFPDLACIARAPDEANWGLIRRRGQWVIRGRLSRPLSDTCAGTLDFDVDVEAPRSLVGHNHLEPGWDAVRAAVPDAVDALSSPGGRLVVVWTRRAILFFAPSGGGLGPPRREEPLAAPEAIVMARWVRGPEVVTFTQRLQEASR